MEIPKIWELLPGLYKAIKAEHEECKTGGGHAFEHDELVSQTVIHIGWGEYSDRIVILAAAAGLCHSGDWIVSEKLKLGKDGNITKAPPEKFREFVSEILKAHADFSPEETELILGAVLNHTENNGEDPDVHILLVDADRLANMHLSVVIRGGQHMPYLQPMDPIHGEIDPSGRSPREKYAHPLSIAWDIENCAKWSEDGNPYALRTKKGAARSKELAAELRHFLTTMKDQYQQVGFMIPRPF